MKTQHKDKNIPQYTKSELFFSFLNKLIAIGGVLAIFVLTKLAIEVCTSQCSGENCQYAMKYTTQIACYCCIVICVFILCNCNDKKGIVKIVEKVSGATGRIYNNFKNGCISKNEDSLNNNNYEE